MIRCPDTIDINTYVGNLTASYTDKHNEPNMVAASVIMFALAGLFFNLNLFSGISDTSAILDPKVRLFLSSALSLFLPVMSYLFSEAKNARPDTTTTSSVAADLSLRAGLILAWMLLVELLRKKVDEIRMRGYSGTIQRAGRVAWLGSLVFFNIRSTGRKAVFAILWILCATKLLQRIAFTEFGKRSYAHGKNARLISSYMAQILERQQEEQPVHDAAVGEELLRRCSYIVMGEEKLADIEPTADGYKLDKKASSSGYGGGGVVRWIRRDDSGVVTVGKVWELDDRDRFFASREQIQRLKRICLSFALFKLLRRRFEHLPAVGKQEEHDSRDLLLKGLYNNGETESSSSSSSGAGAEAMFQVMNDEVNFLSEYYHSVVPVVLASPFFLFVNYFLLNIVVAILCVMAVILCANGDVGYAFQSIVADNYTLKSGVFKIAVCLLHRVRTPEAFFSIVDLSITILLFVIYFYEEIWEFLVFLLSNWFMVSMLYNYTSKPRWLRSTTFRGTLFWSGFSLVMWLRSKMSQPSLALRQFSALNVRWPLKLPLFAAFTGLAVQKRLVPNSVKKSIVDYLVKHGHPGYDLDRGRSALRRKGLLDKLSWACQSDSVAEVILTWHIATSIVEVIEVERRQQTTTDGKGATTTTTTFSRVAMTLSKYCAYLVAFHPELLPENPEKVELVFEQMKEELKAMIGCREYYLSPQRARVRKLVEGPTLTPGDECGSKVVRDGVRLGKLLMTDEFEAGAAANNSSSWEVLAEVWTELIIYLAPSSEEERVMGHEGALVQGGEFITVLWALTTHIGVSRPPTNKPPPETIHIC